MANKNTECEVPVEQKNPSSQEHCTSDGKTNKLKMAMAGLSAVTTVAKTGFQLLQDMRSNAEIGLENDTDNTFIHLETVSRGSTIQQQFQPKLSRGSYAMRAQGSLLPLSGTDGIVSLRLDGSDIAIAIVWCVPRLQFLPGTGSNRLAIGIYNPRFHPNTEQILTFVKTHQQRPPAFLRYIVEDFKERMKTLELDYFVKVMANMNNDESGRVMIQLCETTTQWRVMSPNDPLQPSENDWIQQGQSLTFKTVDDHMSETRFRVVGVIEITNLTTHKLTDAQIRTDGGRISVHPQQMEPFTREAVVVHKYPGTATGSYGTLSFYIEQLDCRVVLMWSLPFNQDFFSNWLALDIRRGREIHHGRLFDRMYSGANVVRKEYKREFGNTFIAGQGVELTASMTSSHRTHIAFKVEMKQD